MANIAGHDCQGESSKIPKPLAWINKPVLSARHMQKTIESIRAFCEKSFTNARHSHDWDHSLRVCKLCIHIGAIENADLDVLTLAAYLHDIGRSDQDKSKGKICHADKGSEIARDLLVKYPISENKKENIIHCVLSHRFRNSHDPQTIEAKVLFDADKLDAIGAVGIARAYLFAGEVGAMLHNGHVDLKDTQPYTRYDTGYREFRLKLSTIKDHMLTSEGKRMANQRHEFMQAFFERFLEEHEGIK